MENDLPICRVCLNATNESINFQTRFECDEYPPPREDDDANAIINYLECLRLCTNLPIDEQDDGPQYLCIECGEELQVVYKFLQKAQNSQAILEEEWEKCYDDNGTIEHTEISIEKIEIAPVRDNDFVEHLVEAESSKDNNRHEVYEDFEMSDDNDFAEIEEVILREIQNEESTQSQYLPEESETSKNNIEKFISKKLKCHICNRFYNSENLLKMHLNYHKRKEKKHNSYICKICGEGFSLQRYLTQHMNEHEDYQEMHKCEFCDKEFVSKTALISHKRIHEWQTLNCNECGKQFNGSYELKIHLSFHKREKEQEKNKCEICGKEFAFQRYLTQHMAIHLDDRESMTCNYCDKVYISKNALINHKRLHEGQTRKCVECGKEFTRPNELKIHMRFHTGERPFDCTMCAKKFVTKGHLKTHMLTHQRIKFECEECGKLFTSTKALKEHSYTHNEMPYPCNFCSKAYPSKQKYKKHLEKMHSNEEEEIDFSQLQSLKSAKNLKKRKNFTYVQLIEVEEANE